MKVAIIDLGTNTFHLLILQTGANNSYYELDRKRIYVSLGEGGIDAAYITPEAEKRALDAMLAFQKIITEHQIEIVYAVGTSALRNATNAAELIKKIKQETNIEVEVISGTREATLIYEGVKRSTTIQDETVLIMDIGGGSVEFIICSNQQSFWQQSFEIGVQRLSNQFHQKDPITADTLTIMEKYLADTLKPLFKECHRYTLGRLIGSSGAFSTLFSIYAERENLTPPPSIPAYNFPIQKAKEICEEIRYSTHEQRLQLAGIEKKRADMIVASAILINFILNKLNINELTVSMYGLKEGLFLEAVYTNPLNYKF